MSAKFPLGGRFETLDSVRGIAAAVVVVDHCLMTVPRFSDYIVRHVVPPVSAADPAGFLLFHTPLKIVWAGYSSVALFFVLSGFVLALPWIEGRPPSYASFAVRRVCRIYLPYLVACCIAMALCAVLAPMRPSEPPSEWFAVDNWTVVPGWTAIRDHVLMTGGSNVYNNAIWSLVHEMRVSLVLPILLIPLLRFRMAGAIATILALILAATAAGKLGLDAYDTASPFSSIQYAALFMMGAAVALHARGLRGWLAARPRSIVWMLLASGLLMLSGKSPVLPQYVLGAGGALVVAASLAPGPLEAFLRRPLLRELGRISFSLYLIHLPVLLTLIYLLHGAIPHAAILLLTVVLALAAAVVFNRMVEEPSMRLGRRLAGRLTRRAATLPQVLASSFPPP